MSYGKREEKVHFSQAETAAEPSLLYICGSGRSGSTLLDMLLGGHSAISALGEVSQLHFYARRSTEHDFCTCGRLVPECPFWLMVEQELAEMRPDLGGSALSMLLTADPRLISLRRSDGAWIKGTPETLNRSRVREALLVLGSRALLRLAAAALPEARLHRQIGLDRHLIYEAVRRAHGTPVVVDSTKTAGDMKGIYLTSPTPVRLVFLKRDGRAVAHARMRRTGCSMRQAAAIWAAEQRKQRLVRMSIPRSRILELRYEELCSNPVDVLSRICRYVGLSYEPGMLDFRGERHNVGGNPMRYRADENQIRLDERWRRELPARDEATFDEIAGKINRWLGYR